MEQIIAEVLEELIVELEITDASDIAILNSKIKNAYREVKAAFNFKEYHTEEFIVKNIEQHISNIKNIAMYDYAKIGAEGESTHKEKNIDRQYENRNKYFKGIVPFAD